MLQTVLPPRSSEVTPTERLRTVDFRLLLVADMAVVLDLEWAVDTALSEAPEGSTAVCLRVARGTPARVIHDAALGLRQITRRRGAKLLIGDRLDVALAVGADGVHLPEEGLPVGVARELLGQRLISAACHSAEGAERRARDGADLVVLGPIHRTDSHPGTSPLGIPALAAGARRARPVPVFAVGGLTPENAATAARAGAYGAAAIRSVLTARDPAGCARSFLRAFGVPGLDDETLAPPAAEGAPLRP